MSTPTSMTKVPTLSSTQQEALRNGTIAALCDRYYLELQLLNYSPRTIETNAYQLRRFVNWCNDRAVNNVSELSLDIVQAYRTYLFHYRNPRTGNQLVASSQSHHLIKLRSICRWMFYQKIVADDFGLSIQIPQVPKKLFGKFLTLAEVSSLLTQPDLSTKQGIRDRAILETFFSTAIRATELSNLTLCDIDFQRQIVHIQHGKGDKERFTPISREALEWIEKYLVDVRPSYASHQQSNILFLTHRGKQIDRGILSKMVHSYLLPANVSKIGGCHLLRHTAATLMLENGADLRSLQTYLGHARLDTTERYTHITLDRLREVHSKTHPTGDQRLSDQKSNIASPPKD
jgi:integrase/recombinase XerD